MKLKEIINSNRLIWVNNQVYIEDYKRINNLNNNEIELNSFIIKGNKLHVEEMDKHLIIISGEIIEIRRKENEYL